MRFALAEIRKFSGDMDTIGLAMMLLRVFVSMTKVFQMHCRRPI